MNDDAIARLAAANEARTPGKWHVENFASHGEESWGLEIARWREYVNVVNFGEDKETAEFIAAASVGVPALLAETERLRTENERWKLILSIEHGQEVYAGTPAGDHLIEQFGRDAVLRERHDALLADLRALADRWQKTSSVTTWEGEPGDSEEVASLVIMSRNDAAEELGALITQHGGDA